MPSNRLASVAVIHTWPRPSSRSNSASRRLGSRWAATSSSNSKGGSPRRSATISAWARTRPSSSAFCSPVEDCAAGISLPRCMTARSWRCGPSVARPAAASRPRLAAKRGREIAAGSALQRNFGARELGVGGRCEPLVQRGNGPCARRRDRRRHARPSLPRARRARPRPQPSSASSLLRARIAAS